ncbi:MAG TPA: serine hydrolase [Coleofasciculaceae cyanobacterium]
MISHRRYLVGALVSALAIVLSIRFIELITLLPSVVNSQIKTPQTKLTKPHPPQSLSELYQLRRYLQSDLDKLSLILNWAILVNPSDYKNLIQRHKTLIKQIQTVEAQIKVNKSAEASWYKAFEQAAKAADIGKLPHASVENWQQAQLLWQQALNSLQKIPPNSFFKTRATKKAREYKIHLSTAIDELEKAQTQLLETIIKQSGLSPGAMITVCKLSGECRHWQGDKFVNPASLSKIPIAIALLDKVNSQKISLDTPISVNSGNFTEDEVARIQVQQRYTLKTLLMEMITYSSNIASNQLLDYIGWDYIDQVLKKRGYPITQIGSKFMGERVMPANPGIASNRMTSNELTQMMVEIYKRKHPGDEVLIEALKHQHDRALGFSAAKGSAAKWLGEKTGESSKAEGTTSAFKILGKTYIITVIDNRSNSDSNIRRCVAEIINHIAKHSYL